MSDHEPTDYTDAHAVRLLDLGPAFEPPTTPDASIGGELTTIPAIRSFLMGGKAIVTIAGNSARYTFKITRKDPDPGSNYTQAVYFISLLTGPDNTADYTYVGILDVDRGAVRLTRKSTYRPDSLPVRAFDWTVGRVWAGRAISPARVWHVGRCGRCGRALTVPSSIESGFGPECAGKLAGE